MASLLLVVKHWEEERKALLQMQRIAMETATTPVTDEVHRVTAGGDSRRLRGLPAIARSVTGAIEGTTAGTDAHVERLSR
jgi:hypothetical protein